jgi:hypothetical protein
MAVLPKPCDQRGSEKPCSSSDDDLHVPDGTPAAVLDARDETRY